MFAIPSLIAAIVAAYSECDRSKVIDIVLQIYPLLKKNCLFTDNETATKYAESFIDSMVAEKYVTAVEPSFLPEILCPIL